jgi:hypothetical protein
MRQPMRVKDEQIGQVLQFLHRCQYHRNLPKSEEAGYVRELHGLLSHSTVNRYELRETQNHHGGPRDVPVRKANVHARNQVDCAQPILCYQLGAQLSLNVGSPTGVNIPSMSVAFIDDWLPHPDDLPGAFLLPQLVQIVLYKCFESNSDPLFWKVSCVPLTKL